MNQGFILPTILIFLMLFTEMSLTALSFSQLQVKINYNIQTHDEELQNLESVLNKVEHKIEAGEISSNDQSPILLKTLTHSLQMTSSTVKYSIEVLPEKSCIHKNGKVFAALFYKTSVWTDKTPLVLQSVYISAGQPTTLRCKFIEPGRASWCLK